MAAEIDDAMRVALRSGAGASDNMAAIALRDGAAAARAGTTAAAKSSALQTFKNNIVSFFRADGRAAIQSTDNAVTLVGNQKTALKSENTAAVSASEKTAIEGAAAGRTAGAETLAKSKFSLPSGTTLAGVGLTAYATYSLITWQATDGKTITITNVKRLDAQRVQITYNPPSSLGFGIRVNDTLDFSGCSSSRCTVPALGNGERVDSLIDDHNLVILKSIADPNAAPSGTPSSTSPSGSPVPSPVTLSGTWGSAVVHSSFSTQFVGSVSDTTAVVFDSAAAVVDAGVNAAAPVAANALGQAGNVAAAGFNALGPVAGAAGGAAKNAFCSIIPFVCDTTFLWICAALCLLLLLGGGAFMLISKKK
jgi:hypothetical protein